MTSRRPLHAHTLSFSSFGTPATSYSFFLIFADAAQHRVTSPEDGETLHGETPSVSFLHKQNVASLEGYFSGACASLAAPTKTSNRLAAPAALSWTLESRPHAHAHIRVAYARHKQQSRPAADAARSGVRVTSCMPSFRGLSTEASGWFSPSVDTRIKAAKHIARLAASPPSVVSAPQSAVIPRRPRCGSATCTLCPRKLSRACSQRAM